MQPYGSFSSCRSATRAGRKRSAPFKSDDKRTADAEKPSCKGDDAVQGPVYQDWACPPVPLTPSKRQHRMRKDVGKRATKTTEKKTHLREGESETVEASGTMPCSIPQLIFSGLGGIDVGSGPRNRGIAATAAVRSSGSHSRSDFIEDSKSETISSRSFGSSVSGKGGGGYYRQSNRSSRGASKGDGGYYNDYRSNYKSIRSDGGYYRSNGGKSSF